MLETIGVVIVAGLYGLTLIALSLYGLNFLCLVFIAWRHRRDQIDAPPLVTYPTVTLQIPIYNERYVAERAIEAACRLDWPRDRLEIQVLDDSTDATREIVSQAVARLRAGGVNVSHLHRSDRAGYKAGALREGLTTAKGEYLAIFDADFVPPPDFLRRALPYLVADSRIGFVQARWGHLNREASLLTRLQACNIDSHFTIEQFARDRAGWFMNFNGTAGVWRRRAIEEAGGWNIGTLTEDLDLSYRAVLSGWRTRLLPDLVAPAELVGEAGAYRRQQTRWAHGSIECATRLLPLVWRARLPWRMKIEAFFHLTGYAIQVLVLVMSIVYPFLLMLADRSHVLNLLYWTGWVFAPIAAAPAVFFAYAQIALEGRRWWRRRLPDLGLILLLGSCMVLNSTRAVLRGLRRDVAAFERTPKSGQIGRRRASSGSEYTLPVDPIVLGEIALCVFHLNTARLAWAAQSWGIFLYAVSFAAGLAYLSGLSLWQRREMLLAGLRAAISNWSMAGRKESMRRISQRSEG
jgi:cellulose synthase/poly-beta-1,6-N-acetylglucosamine synthase-like glycosyltransferase